jgi:hypothetical protein
MYFKSIRVGSVLSTVSVTLERFFAIVFPLRDVTCIKRWLIPVTTSFTIIYNFPKFFEISCLRDPDTHEYMMVGSKLRQNQVWNFKNIYLVKTEISNVSISGFITF